MRDEGGRIRGEGADRFRGAWGPVVFPDVGGGGGLGVEGAAAGEGVQAVGELEGGTLAGAVDLGKNGEEVIGRSDLEHLLDKAEGAGAVGKGEVAADAALLIIG